MSWLHLETARLLLDVAQFAMEVYDRWVDYHRNEEEANDEEFGERKVRYVLAKVEPDPEEEDAGTGSSHSLYGVYGW